MVGQTESFVYYNTRARVCSFDPAPRYPRSVRKLRRFELNVEGSGYCAHISLLADLMRSFLPPPGVYLLPGLMLHMLYLVIYSYDGGTGRVKMTLSF